MGPTHNLRVDSFLDIGVVSVGRGDGGGGSSLTWDLLII